MTIKEFVEEARKIHGDKYDYKSVDFIKKTDKVDIVCHSNAEYVKGNIFTNNMEGFWSHFRRMVAGCYHHMSDEHLQQYVDEACFRWNTRKMSESERFAHMFKTSIWLAKPNREFVLCKVG